MTWKSDYLLTFTNLRMKDDFLLVSNVKIIRKKAIVNCKTSASVTSSPSRNQTGKICNCYRFKQELYKCTRFCSRDCLKLRTIQCYKTVLTKTLHLKWNDITNTT